MTEMTDRAALEICRDMLKSKCATLQHSHYHYPDGDDYRDKFERALERVEGMINELLHPTGVWAFWDNEIDAIYDADPVVILPPVARLRARVRIIPDSQLDDGHGDDGASHEASE